MDPFPWHYLAAIAFLIVLNGVFAMSELAIVSARTARLRMAADKGSASAEIAMRLAAEPGKFLSTVQIGITLIGVIAGAVSGSTLGAPVGDRLALLGIPDDTAQTFGFALVIVITTFASVVDGELVPKQLALRGAE
ncbi:MAG: CNNM domain-containing protein, partial [Alteraurantiacibacter sp.]